MREETDEGTSAPEPPTAGALLATLWALDPPALGEPEGASPGEPARMRASATGLFDPDSPAPDPAITARLAASVTRLSAEAELAAARLPAAERAAARLLAETARVLRSTLDCSAMRARRPDASERRPAEAVLRISRMERWLASRAEGDPHAQPAADLCLWVLEHLEHAS